MHFSSSYYIFSLVIAQAHELTRKRTKEELRKLWRESAKQIIILSRMEKENARLQARQNEHEIKRIKLEYDDISVCSKHAADIWDNYLENQTRITQKTDATILLQAIKNGSYRKLLTYTQEDFYNFVVNFNRCTKD